MARTGRPRAELILSETERATLTRWARRAKTSQALALRSKIVLACAAGATNTDLDVATGKIIGQHQRRHRHQEFLRFLKKIDANPPSGLDLHLICEGYATHKT